MRKLIAHSALKTRVNALLFAALLALVCAPGAAVAQNPTCPTRPVGDNSNACASTSFVQSAIPAAGQPLTKTDDTNITVTLGGSPATALVNPASITMGWAGTLAAGRLNANVVQSVVNDTNVTGSISAQTLTLGWASTLSVARGGTGIGSGTSGGIPYYSGSTTIASSGVLSANNPVIGGGAGVAPSSGTRTGNTTAFATSTGALTNGNCVKIDASGNFIDAGSTCGGGSGVDQNILNTQTANYTIATTDCGKIIQAGTGATGLFTLTLPAVGGFASNCTVSIKNGDTGRGKVLSGFPSDFGRGSMLWPLQFGQVRIVNGAWVTAINPGFWQPISAPTFNVNHASGSDAATNDCLSTGAAACATLTRAMTILQNSVSCPAVQPIIQNAQETFTEQLAVVGPACGFGSSNCVIVQGTPGTPANTVWQIPGGNTYGLFLNDYACVIINGFKLAGTAAGQIGFYSGKFSDLAFENMEFGAITGSSRHMQANYGHIVYEGGTYVVSGAADNHWVATNLGRIEIQTPTISVPNALTFTLWANADYGGHVYFNGSFTGAGSAGGSTGKKYNATHGGFLNLNAATLPGATAGTINDTAGNRGEGP